MNNFYIGGRTRRSSLLPWDKSDAFIVSPEASV